MTAGATLLANITSWLASSHQKSDGKTSLQKWRQVLDKEPSLRYFKMAEAMNRAGQFERGWTIPLRDQRVFELVEIIEELDPFRIECFLNRSYFDDFVKGIIRGGHAFNDPYFICFCHIVLSIAARAEDLGWNRQCDFIFDEQGKLGEVALSKWKWMKQNIDGENAANVSEYLGAPPTF